MKKSIGLFTFVILSFQICAAAKKIFKSGPDQVALLELFSSEGCSSCPPAEKQLYALKSDPNLWKKFVPVNFHVDYWNQLGWVDRFSNNRFTTRQNEYAAAWKVERIYTPEFVLNGQEAGSKLGDLNKAPNKNVGELNLSVDSKNEIKAEYIPASNAKSKYQIHIALLGNGFETKVAAGENKGELLKHNFVALYTEQQTAVADKKSKTFLSKFKFPSYSKEAKSLSLIAWITEENSTQPLQSTGGDL